MKTDAQLKSDVTTELQWEPTLHATDIEACSAAWNAPGVTGVENDLAVTY